MKVLGLQNKGVSKRLEEYTEEEILQAFQKTSENLSWYIVSFCRCQSTSVIMKMRSLSLCVLTLLIMLTNNFRSSRSDAKAARCA